MPWWQQVSKCYGRHLVGCSKGLLPSATSPRPTWGFPQGSFLAQCHNLWMTLGNSFLTFISLRSPAQPGIQPSWAGSQVSLASHLVILSALHLAGGNSHVPVRPNTFLTLPAALSLSSWAALVSLCLWDCKQVQSLCPHMFPTQSLRSVSHLGPQLLGGL